MSSFNPELDGRRIGDFAVRLSHNSGEGVWSIVAFKGNFDNTENTVRLVTLKTFTDMEEAAVFHAETIERVTRWAAMDALGIDIDYGED